MSRLHFGRGRKLRFGNGLTAQIHIFRCDHVRIFPFYCLLIFNPTLANPCADPPWIAACSPSRRLRNSPGDSVCPPGIQAYGKPCTLWSSAPVLAPTLVLATAAPARAQEDIAHAPPSAAA